MDASSVSPRTDSKPFPDVILRSQFFDLAGRATLSSEQRLMLAVLADAINIVHGFHCGDGSRKRTTFNEARAWIFARGSAYPLSFENVCDALGLNTAALRFRLGVLMSETSSGAHVTPLRLRLKEAGRVQRVTVNRVRRRTSRRLRDLRTSAN